MEGATLQYAGRRKQIVRLKSAAEDDMVAALLSRNGMSVSSPAFNL